MIKKYERYEEKYYNVLEIIALFIQVEYIELLVFLNIYDLDTNKIDTRKHVYFLLLLSTVSITVISIIIMTIISIFFFCKAIV